MKVRNHKIYTEVVWEWNESTNQLEQVSEQTEFYSGRLDLAAKPQSSADRGWYCQQVKDNNVPGFSPDLWAYEPYQTCCSLVSSVGVGYEIFDTPDGYSFDDDPNTTATINVLDTGRDLNGGTIGTECYQGYQAVKVGEYDGSVTTCCLEVNTDSYARIIGDSYITGFVDNSGNIDGTDICKVPGITFDNQDGQPNKCSCAQIGDGAVTILADGTPSGVTDPNFCGGSGGDDGQGNFYQTGINFEQASTDCDRYVYCYPDADEDGVVDGSYTDVYCLSAQNWPDSNPGWCTGEHGTPHIGSFESTFGGPDYDDCVGEFDQCGVCNGDNSTCADCAGNPNGNAVLDNCGVCNGDNTTCCNGAGEAQNDCSTGGLCNCNCFANYDGGVGIPGRPCGDTCELTFDECSVCNGDNSTCADCAGIPNGTNILLEYCYTDIDADQQAEESLVSPICAPQGDTCGTYGYIEILPADFAGYVTSPGFDVCDGDYDDCCVCNGNNSTCADCAGVPNGNSANLTCWKDLDGNGVGDGFNVTQCTLETDCANVNWDGFSWANPSAGTDDCEGELDELGNCCATYTGGNSSLDECGICNGSGSVTCGSLSGGSTTVGYPCGTTKVCPHLNSGETYGNFIAQDQCPGYDECGICDGDSSTCEDCAGVPNGNSYLDNCDQCVNNVSQECIADCNGTWGGDYKEVACYFDADGDGVGDYNQDIKYRCVPPDANGGYSCDNENGYYTGNSDDCVCELYSDNDGLDECGVCCGDNTTCADCAGVPNGDAYDINCYFDSDGDGQGSGDPVVYCSNPGCPDDWVQDNTDNQPDCATNDTDDCGLCAGQNYAVNCSGDLDSLTNPNTGSPYSSVAEYQGVCSLMDCTGTCAANGGTATLNNYGQCVANDYTTDCAGNVCTAEPGTDGALIYDPENDSIGSDCFIPNDCGDCRAPGDPSTTGRTCYYDPDADGYYTAAHEVQLCPLDSTCVLQGNCTDQYPGSCETYSTEAHPSPGWVEASALNLDASGNFIVESEGCTDPAASNYDGDHTQPCFALTTNSPDVPVENGCCDYNDYCSNRGVSQAVSGAYCGGDSTSGSACDVYARKTDCNNASGCNWVNPVLACTCYNYAEEDYEGNTVGKSYCGLQCQYDVDDCGDCVHGLAEDTSINDIPGYDSSFTFVSGVNVNMDDCNVCGGDAIKTDGYYPETYYRHCYQDGDLSDLPVGDGTAGPNGEYLICQAPDGGNCVGNTIEGSGSQCYEYTNQSSCEGVGGVLEGVCTWIPTLTWQSRGFYPDYEPLYGIYGTPTTTEGNPNPNSVNMWGEPTDCSSYLDGNGVPLSNVPDWDRGCNDPTACNYVEGLDGCEENEPTNFGCCYYPTQFCQSDGSQYNMENEYGLSLGNDNCCDVAEDGSILETTYYCTGEDTSAYGLDSNNPDGANPHLITHQPTYDNQEQISELPAALTGWIKTSDSLGLDTDEVCGGWRTTGCPDPAALDNESGLVLYSGGTTRASIRTEYPVETCRYCPEYFDFYWADHLVNVTATKTVTTDSNSNDYVSIGDSIFLDNVGDGYCFHRGNIDVISQWNLSRPNPAFYGETNQSAPLQMNTSQYGGEQQWDSNGYLYRFIAQSNDGSQNLGLTTIAGVEQLIGLDILNVAHNNIGGDIPEVLNSTNLTNLRNIYLNGNNFTGIQTDGTTTGICSFINSTDNYTGKGLPGANGTSEPVYATDTDSWLYLMDNNICPTFNVSSATGNAYYPACLTEDYKRSDNSNQQWVDDNLGISYIDFHTVYGDFDYEGIYEPNDIQNLNGCGSYLQGCTAPQARNYWPAAMSDSGNCDFDDYFHFPYDPVTQEFGGAMTTIQMIQALHATIYGLSYNYWGSLDVTAPGNWSFERDFNAALLLGFDVSDADDANQALQQQLEFLANQCNFDTYPEHINECIPTFSNTFPEPDSIITIYDGLWWRSGAGGVDYQPNTDCSPGESTGTIGSGELDYCPGDARPLEFIQRVLKEKETLQNADEIYFGTYFPQYGANIAFQGLDYFEDFDVNGNGQLDTDDINYWLSIGRVDIVEYINDVNANNLTDNWRGTGLTIPPATQPLFYEYWAPDTTTTMGYSKSFVPDEIPSGQYQCSNGGSSATCYTDIYSCGIANEDFLFNIEVSCTPCGTDIGGGGTCIPLTVESAKLGHEKIIKVNTKSIKYFTDGTSPTLHGSNIHTSSLDDTNKKYYYGITDGDPNSSSTDTQFHIAWGHIKGSGSNSDGGDIKSTSEAVYKQYASLLLDDNKIENGFLISSGSDVTSDGLDGNNDDWIYVINFKRKRFKDQLQPGTWTLTLSGSNGATTAGKTIELTDNSNLLLNNEIQINDAGRKFDIISGSAGVAHTDYNRIGGRYGFFYPDVGIMIFGEKIATRTSGIIGDASSPDVVLFNGPESAIQNYGFNPNLSTTEDGGNALALANCMKKVDGNVFTLYGEKETTNTIYVCRLGNSDFNHTNNFTILSASSVIPTANDMAIRDSFSTAATSSAFTGSTGDASSPIHGDVTNMTITDDSGDVVVWPGSNVSTMDGDQKSFITNIILWDHYGRPIAIAALSKPLMKGFDREVVIKVKLEF